MNARGSWRVCTIGCPRAADEEVVLKWFDRIKSRDATFTNKRGTVSLRKPRVRKRYAKHSKHAYHCLIPDCVKEFEAVLWDTDSVDLCASGNTSSADDQQITTDVKHTAVLRRGPG